MVSALYYSTLLLYLISFFIQLLKWRKTGHITSTLAVAVNGVLLTIISSQTGQVPVFNVFESFLLITFIMGILGISVVYPAYNHGIRNLVWLEIIVLLGITLFFPKEPAPVRYDHSDIYVVLFHLFRYSALALMLYSTACFGQFLIKREQEERVRFLSHQGRNFLILGAVMFLLSEYTGIIWCQRGWGDFWMWSRNFIQSTIIMLYLMLAFHIPGKGKASENIRAVVGGLTGVVVLGLTIIRGFF